MGDLLGNINLTPKNNIKHFEKYISIHSRDDCLSGKLQASNTRRQFYKNKFSLKKSNLVFYYLTVQNFNLDHNNPKQY